MKDFQALLSQAVANLVDEADEVLGIIDGEGFDTENLNETDTKYVNDLKALRQRFVQNIDGSKPVAAQDNRLAELEQIDKDWAAAFKTANEPVSDALKTFQSELQQTKSEWQSMRPLYEEWYQVKEEIEQAGEEVSQELIDKLEAADAAIQAI